MTRQKWLILVIGTLLVGGTVEPLLANRLGDKKSARFRDSKIFLVPGLNGGYNRLDEGYDGYENLGNAGLDLYVGVRRPTNNLHWKYNFLFRFSFDYFPLQVPEANLGLEEDIYSVNGAIIYQFRRTSQYKPPAFIPFIGIGGGYYRDVVTLDTPATGKISGSENHFGLNASVGIFLPTINFIVPFRIAPEVRYHRLNVPDGVASNFAIQAAITFWPRTSSD